MLGSASIGGEVDCTSRYTARLPDMGQGIANPFGAIALGRDVGWFQREAEHQANNIDEPFASC